MINQKKNNKAFTLFETMLSISLLSTGVMTGAYFLKAQMEEDNAKRHANFTMSIIKLVDRRIEVDGYSFTSWDLLPNPSNTSELVDFTKRAFVSKNNLECGLSNGWEPLLDTASAEKLMPCDFGESSYKLYDYQLQKGQNNEGFLRNVDVIMKLNSSISMSEEGVLLQHKKILNLLKSSAPSLEKGMYHTSFANFNDLTNDSLDITECRTLGNNCVIKASWRSDGYAESLKIDGSNNITNDNISFALDYRSDSLRCDMWEYDDEDNYTFNGNVECGVGLYSKTLNPIVATIDTVVKEVNVVKPIILKENCLVYQKDINGFLVSNGTSECGLFTGDNGLTNVVQVVEEMHVGTGKSLADYSSTVIVDNLITKELNTSFLEIKDKLELKTGSLAELNILVAENGAPAEFKNIITTDTLNVLTKTLIEGDAVIRSLSGDALTVNNGNVSLNNVLNTVNGTLDVKDTDVGNIKLKEDTSILNASGCSYIDEGSTVFNGSNVLTCRETLVSGVYRWASSQFGEVGVFESSCPEGWTDFSDGSARTLLNSGWFIDKTGKKIKYNVGDKGGAAKVKLTVSELAAHDHDFRDAFFAEAWGDYGPKNMRGAHGGQDNDNNLYTRNITTADKGANAAHENRSPYKVVKICQYQKGNGLTESGSEPSFDPNNYWYPYPSEITDWVQKGAPYNCTGYTYENLSSGEYWSTYCDLDFEKFEKEREINYVTGAIRYTGIIDTYTKTERPSVIWERGPHIYDPWYPVGTEYNCSVFPVSVAPNGSSNHRLVLSCQIDKERWYQQTIVQKDSLGGIMNSQNWDVKQLESGTFTENFEYFVSDSSLAKTCDAWYVTGSTSWGAATSTVNYGQSFTQNRNVYYDRTCRHYTTLKGNSYLVKTTTENKTEGESRSAVGTRNYITHTGYGGWGGWSNNGGVYSCGSYSPATSTVTSGTRFTQTRSCRQNQRRARTLYNYWANGAVTYKSTSYGYRTINVSQSRTATGTKVSFGTWTRINIGNSTKYGCTGGGVPSGFCSPIGTTRSAWIPYGQSSGVPICRNATYRCQ